MAEPDSDEVADADGKTFVMPLQAEQLAVTRRRFETGRVVVSTITRERAAQVDELLVSEHADIERVEIRQLVDAMPQVRQEGDTVVIPIVEEVVVVERRLFLKEEVRIRRVQTTQRHQETVMLREQSLDVTRDGAEASAVGDPAAQPATNRRPSMASETIVAVFDTETHAEAAIADLVAQGVPSSAIQHYSKTASNTAGGDVTIAEQNKPQGGFWSWLTGEEAHDHNTLYDRSIETGGTVVTVITDDRMGEKVVSLLQAHSPVDLEERGEQFGLGSATMPAANTAATAGKDAEVMALSEESLEVGKRQVDRGTTRLRRYVVERPVEEQIRLRDETVTVFRRPVSGTATVGADAFTDKTIEVRETAEEAMVAKTSRVVEEVVVQKGINEHTETVRDTLRHDEVEVTGPHSGEAGVGGSRASVPGAASVTGGTTTTTTR